MTLADIATRLFDALPVDEGGPALCAIAHAAERLEFSEDEMRGPLSPVRVEQLRRVFRAIADALDADTKNPPRPRLRVLPGGEA